METNTEKQTCINCIMDTSDSDIVFDKNGICNYCHEFNEKLIKYRYGENKEQENLKTLRIRIKSRQKGEYDSIIGLSGGVDSSYVAYLAMNMGLNPLCVHFDNGWNSNIAVKNISNIIRITGFSLSTYVIDWLEFRDLQRSFLKAGVIDIEMLTDHAITASLFKIGRDMGIKTVLSGTNYATEHGMPRPWVWSKMDLRNIKSIHKQYGDINLKSFPTISTLRWRLIQRFGMGGVYEEPLNLINYRKMDAMDTLKKVFKWQYYGGKHYESVFTKFYQAYILPTKFGVDKRLSHLSALIRNGEISRDEAITELNHPIYEKNSLLRDKNFILKKIGFSENEFDAIMSSPPVPHNNFLTDQTYIKHLTALGKAIFGPKIDIS
jgi:N-acetyl sugar amidotransferase